MINETENRFIAYEYKQFKTESRRASFYIDGYANFGWELDRNVMTASKETERQKNLQQGGADPSAEEF